MKPLVPLFVSLCCASAIAQEFSGLALEARAEKATYAMSEPVTLTVRASNPTSAAVMAHADLSPSYGLLEIQIAASGGDFRRYSGWGWGALAARPSPVKMAPGDAIASEVVIFPAHPMRGGGDSPPVATVLDRPGKYRFRVFWANLGFEERIQAADFEVEIQAPSAEDSVLGKAVSLDPELAAFLAVGGSDATAVKAEKLLQDAGNAAGAGHLALSLGRHYIEARDTKKAEPFLTRALNGPAGSARKRKALLLLVQAAMMQKDEVRALKLLREAEPDFAGSVDEAVYRAMLREIGG
ncbi:MAG: hypothetical protein AMXMBFR19_18730 [Chthonomonadaceae bacterium]|uniref:Tetratricopeptide repeat protein n=1 Tax=Candidatus Nitrosymbiomonas proteolyticus TaxID=2608984 RepID=A0A809S7P3_9BACT|nr:hypothetical protein NPRO_00060 [Candidatus Nitrosymbiomonas proteolyticus]